MTYSMVGEAGACGAKTMDSGMRRYTRVQYAEKGFAFLVGKEVNP